MTKRSIDKRIFKLIKESSRPISTREMSQKLKIAWHTADRYCLKLKIEKKVDCFTIGKSTAWHVISGHAKNTRRGSQHKR